jgi:hypothetical protein
VTAPVAMSIAWMLRPPMTGDVLENSSVFMSGE